MKIFGLMNSSSCIKPILRSIENRQMLPLSEKEDKKQTKVPFSSLAGRILTRKSAASPAYVNQKLQSIEENCDTKALPISNKLKLNSRRKKDKQLFKRMKTARIYIWPQRHLRSSTQKSNFNFINNLSTQTMEACSVEMDRISENEIEAYKSVRNFKVCLCALSEEKISYLLQRKKKSTKL